MPIEMCSAHRLVGVAMVGMAILLLGSLLYVSEAFPFPSDHESIALLPNVGQFGPRATLTLWQLPKGPVRKVLLLLKGRDASPYGFWDRSPSCPLCRGLPESRRITLDALSLNYAVVVPESLEERGDWGNWPEDNPDAVNVVHVLSEWRREHGLQEKVPTVALGVSAGGRLLSTLGLRRGLFESIAVMIADGVEDAWERVTPHYPPTVFLHMPKAEGFANAVSSARLKLEAKGVPTAEYTWHEHPITPNLFFKYIPGLDRATSIGIFEALKANGSLLDDRDFLYDMIFSYDVLWSWHVLPPNPCPRNGEGPLKFADSVVQELSLAYAMHCIFSRRDREMFQWFEGFSHKKTLRGSS